MFLTRRLDTTQLTHAGWQVKFLTYVLPRDLVNGGLVCKG